jgi:hypothetical protein
MLGTALRRHTCPCDGLRIATKGAMRASPNDRATHGQTGGRCTHPVRASRAAVVCRMGEPGGGS